jgi:hypothetical protein
MVNIIYFDVFYQNKNMFSMYSTPLDILYLALTVGFTLLVIFLLFALWHLIRILRDVNKISAKTKDMVTLINHYLWQPIKIMMMIMDKTKDFTSKKSKKNSDE